MKKLIFLGLVLMSAGCLSSGPDSNADFGRVERIEDIEGVYKNLGEGGENSFRRYLSSIIWPKDPPQEPKMIETIEVRKVADKTLNVKAIAGGIVKKESAFVEGKDFTISNGRIVLKREGGIMPGETLMIGAYSGSEVLGIDSSGHGKYRQSGATAGLVVGLFPFILGAKEDVRFVRLSR